jgi:hypothetical protein
MMSILRTGFAGRSGMDVEPTWTMERYGTCLRMDLRDGLIYSNCMVHVGSWGRMLIFMLCE